MNIDDYINSPLPFNEEINNVFKENEKLTIFEIGSCEGEDSIRLQRKFPNSTIYTFEALPANIPKIKRNFKRYGLDFRRIFQVALGNNDGSSSFYVSSGHPDDQPKTNDWDYGNKSSSLLPPKEHKNILKWVKFNKKIKVKTQRLDTFCKEHNIKSLDFLFIDVQGAELMVLRGAGEMLGRVRAVWMEVEAVELYENQPLKDDVETFMKENGFLRLMDTVDTISGDQLYVRQHTSESYFKKLKNRISK